MSDYARANSGGATHFGDKDALTTGDPNKVIVGSQFDSEYNAIVTAISTKYDSDDLASQAEAEAESSNTKLITPLRLAQWSDANGGMVGDIQALADPNADRVLFWDDSAGAAALLTVSTGLAISTTSLSLSHLGIEALVDPNADRILFWDDSAGAAAWLTVGTGLSVTTTTLATNDSAIVHDSLSGFVADEHVAHTGVSVISASAGLAAVTNNLSSNIGLSIDVSTLTDFGTTAGVDLDVDYLILDDGGTEKKVLASQIVTPQPGTAETGTTATLDEADFGKVVLMGNVANITVTLPNGLKEGFWCTILNSDGTGSVILSATTTLNTKNSLTTVTQQYGAVTVYHAGSNVWYAFGDLDS